MKKLFPNIKLHIYKEFYKKLSEYTVGEKIIKLRLMKNIGREEFARLLHFHCDTLEGWELHNVMPKPENILKLCEFYHVTLGYFHEYYELYYNNPGKLVRVWKDKNSYSYPDAMKLLNISHSGFARLLSGKISLSYEMYLKLKGLEVF